MRQKKEDEPPAWQRLHGHKPAAPSRRKHGWLPLYVAAVALNSRGVRCKLAKALNAAGQAAVAAAGLAS